jgi:hypothetical protein
MFFNILYLFRLFRDALYDVVFSAGRYEIEYEYGVKCIKKTSRSYRVERADGTTRVIRQDCIMELKEVVDVTNQGVDINH